VSSQQYEGQADGVAVLSMDGDLDLSRSVEIGRAIQRAESLEPGVLVLDLRRVTFLDSTMLREIVAAHLRARRQGRRIAVAAVSEAVRRVFRITLLECRVEIVDDPADVGAGGSREPSGRGRR
jgi:anti-anti-sigma factor